MGGVADQVLVAPARRVEPRVEIMRGSPKLLNPDIIADERVEPAVQLRGLAMGRGPERDLLSERMDSSVGTAGPVDPRRCVEQLPEGTFESALNGRGVGLELPAVEAAAVVLDGGAVTRRGGVWHARKLPPLAADSNHRLRLPTAGIRGARQ